MHEKLSPIETLLDPVCAGPLPVADRLELRRLADALCHASKVTDEPPPNTSRADAAIAALKRFKANLKRRTDARDGLTSKRLMDLPEDARAILLSSNAFVFRDEIQTLENQRTEIESKLEEAPVATPRLHPNLPAIYQGKITSLIDEQNTPDTVTQANKAIRQLIEKIRLVPEGNTLNIELFGELAALLSLGIGPNDKHPLADAKGGASNAGRGGWI